MRVAPGEGEFVDFLTRVGEGTNYEPNTMKDATMIVAHRDQLIDFVFPWASLADPITNLEQIRHGAILAPRNIDVDTVNSDTMDRVPGDAIEFLSIDTLVVQGAENPLRRTSRLKTVTYRYTM